MLRMAQGPDASSKGLLLEELSPDRYAGYVHDPLDITGMVIDLVPAGARVLDVGCGSGQFSKLIIDHKEVEIVGFEPQPERAEAARKLGFEVHVGELTEEYLRSLPPFDVVLFLDVLEHVMSPSELLAIARTGLKPGGFVVASIPNVAHWTVRLDILRGKFNYQPVGIMDSTHLRWFTASTVRMLFESADFQVDDLLATPGCSLPDYNRRWPWRRIRPKTRDPFIRWATRHWPRLFGCQHIVKASPVDRLSNQDSELHTKVPN